jgi:SAM-dependent methyltransferase
MEQLERHGSEEPPPDGSAAAWAARFSRHYDQPGVAGAYARQRFQASWRMRLQGWREAQIVTALVRRVSGGRPMRSVADMPSGAGRLSGVLGATAKAPVIQIDRSPSMLMFAGGPIRAVGDAMALPLADGATDLLLCNRLLHHLPDAAARIAVLRELRRVAGSAIVSFYDSASASHARRRRKGATEGARISRRYAQTRASFEDEARGAGWRIVTMRAVLRWLSSQTYALLE